MTDIASERPASATALTFERTVARSHAHRRALGEVFVADSVADGDTTFYCAVQIPRAHSLWYDRPTIYHDPLAMAEAARQGSFVVLHRYLGVPVGLPISMQRYEFDVVDRELFLDDERTPLDAILRYDIVSRVDRGADFSDLTLAGELTIGGRVAMTSTADVVLLARGDYEALRTHQLRRMTPGEPDYRAAPLPPAAVGRVDPRNVVIGAPAAAGTAWDYPLLPDRRHPALFDHEYDHVPGPFIIEAFRQAALDSAVREHLLGTANAVVLSCSSRFTQFAEFGAPLLCRSTPADPARPGTARVDLELRQFDRVLTIGTLELAESATWRSAYLRRGEAQA